jgi:hypothetical protein
MSTYVKDLLERVVVTFLEAFVAALVLSVAVSGLNIENVEAAGLAAIAAVIALVKGLIAKPINNADTASLTV